MTDKEYDNTNRGVLFRNKKKTKDNQPDMNGSINIEGVEYDLAGWKNVAKQSNESYLSLKVKPKSERQETAKKPAPKPREEPELSDDIPFIWATVVPTASILGALCYGQSFLQMWV